MKVLQGWVLAAALCPAGLWLYLLLPLLLLLLACVLLPLQMEVLQGWVLAAACCPAGCCYLEWVQCRHAQLQLQPAACSSAAAAAAAVPA
jgi:hypothetical protein